MLKNHVLSFKELKQRISIEQVLRHYNLFDGLQPRGKSHRGSCPLCEAADGTPFSVSLEKNCFQCFSCHASGNILDFVTKWEGVSIREAGQILTRNLAEEKEPHTASQTVEKTTEREPPQAKKAGPPAPARPADGGEAGERSDKALDAQTPAAIDPQGETLSQNEPLTFALKNIEPDHPSVKALGIQEDILTAFGVGYYRGRGMMENRIVIPVYNTSKQLIAYAGFHPKERTYTYPPKFRPDLALYNLASACAAGGEEHGVILVRHPLEVVLLASAGHLNALAIMGERISTAQMSSLFVEHGAGAKVTLFWPTHTDVTPTLTDLLAEFFVRVRRYEDKPPLGFSAEEVRELLS